VGAKRPAEDATLAAGKKKRKGGADDKGGAGSKGGAGGAGSAWGGPGRNFDPTSGCGVVVADLMAGVGPFAVPLALRGAAVHANDLNPESHKWLVHNAAANKVTARVAAYNLDARGFVAALRGRASASVPRLAAVASSGPIWFDHAIMNLPQSAPEFLDAFRGLLHVGPAGASEAAAAAGSGEGGGEGAGGGRSGGWQVEALGARRLPMVHVHCFERELDGEDPLAGPKQRAVARASAAIGHSLALDEVDVHVVRYVSPQKPMFCLSFRLPLEVALAPPLDL
jgi:tRNA (guanine37-N1)-methyltransferase